MNAATQFVTTNWHTIVTVALALWTAANLAFSRVANSLPAPTATSTPRYIWWFQFVNNMALNSARAKNLARIEDSPNFEAAAEAYMQKKLNGGKNAPGN